MSSSRRTLAAEPVLSVRDLVTTVQVGSREVAAVEGVSFDVPAGGALGLVGESGCGKSLTALSLLRLLDEPRVRVAAGEVRLAGQDLLAMSEPALRRLRGDRITMVFQEPSTALNPVMTLGDQVGEPLRTHRGLDRHAAFEAAIGLLGQVGIPAAAERARGYPHQMSGGMKQRALIAMALACEPAVLVADEPTTALDVTVQAQILAILKDMRRERGMALVLVSHDLGVVAEVCDEIAVMYAGRIVERAPTRVLFASPRHPYTVALLTALRALDEDGPARLPVLRGAVPPLGGTSAGCAFAERCERVQPDCLETVPPLEEQAPGHLVRCRHPEEPWSPC